MTSPLKNIAYDILKEKKQITDDELLDSLNDRSSCSKNDLNKVLMQLEILGLVNIRWLAKDKRRIELVEGPPVPLSRDRNG